jgi:hypothetical protein
MGARDGLQEDEPDVPGPDTPGELALAESPSNRVQPPPPDESRSRGEFYAEHQQRAEGGWEPRLLEAPRAELERFEPERAGLPPMSLDAAADYIAQHRTARPWLRMADAASPEARRIIAALDAEGGHGHIRHEGWVTEEASMRRAAYREDPAQLDLGKRYLGVDGLKQNDRPHKCGSASTRITDPDAFATAFARGVEHPKVRAGLDMPFDPDRWQGEVTVAIAELLGAEGHQYCTGWQLEAVGGTVEAARKNRATWLGERTDGRDFDVPAPRVRPVPTFEGGDMLFVVGQNRTRDGYEIATMYPLPPRAGH